MRVAGFVFVLALLLPRQGDACSCMVTTDAQVTPGPLDVAPLDTHVFITLETGWEHAPVCDKHPCVTPDYALSLRIAASAKEIAFTTRTIAGPEVTSLEWIPKELLAASTRYEVVRTDRSGKSPIRVIGTFKTGVARDATPPVWSGIKNVWWQGVPMIECGGLGTAIAVVFIDKATDESPVRYGLWKTSAGGKIDYGAPPLGWVVPNRDGVIPIGKGGCDPALFKMNPNDKLRLGIRPIDSAGNLGTVSEVDVSAKP